MKISTRIFIGYALILLLFGAVAFVNHELSDKVNENTVWVANSEAMIRSSSRLQRVIIDMENGFRGFLLTGKEKFLEPYIDGIKESQMLYDEVSSLIYGNKFQLQKLDTIQKLHIAWQKDFAGPMIISKRNSLLSRSGDIRYDRLFDNELQNEVGKKLTDHIRAHFKEFSDYEYKLRQARRERLTTSINRTGQISTILVITSIIISLVGALYITRIIGVRIKKMVDVADVISKGNFKIAVEDHAKDELSHLSRSLDVMAKTLDESFTDLEKKNTELDQFAYVVSHDLKAPLRGIDNVLAWIEEDVGKHIDKQTEEYLNMIKGRVRRMENLINGILQVSRIGRSKKPLEEVKVSQLLDDVIEILSPPPGFSIRYQQNMPVLFTEKVYLHQVFANLIGNAIKYHDKKNGNIFIGFKELENYYRFYVKDDGPGIEPEYHKKIFVIFQTLQERDAFESTGVGLSIVKKILDDKGCTIELESEPGKGSTFYFTWPKNESN